LSSEPSPAEYAALRRRTLDYYDAISLLMLLGIAVLVAYVLTLGSLTAPGPERSFGLAVALMALMGAVLFHVADRTYRVWPLGRHFRPSPPNPITTSDWVRLLKVLVFVAAVASVAYLLAGLLA
jgi:hypothetical protein